MKQFAVFALVVLLFSCSPNREVPESGVEKRELERGTQNAISENLSKYDRDVRVLAGTSLLDLDRSNDKDVIARQQVEYYSETDRIKNIAEIEPSSVVDQLFAKPFVGFSFGIHSDDKRNVLYESVEAVAAEFGLKLESSDIQVAYNASAYETIKLESQDLSVYLLKLSDSRYDIWVVEIPAKGEHFQSSLPIDSSPEQVERLLGEPNFKKSDGSTFIYNFATSLRQLNLHWNGNVIEKIQYIRWNGI